MRQILLFAFLLVFSISYAQKPLNAPNGVKSGATTITPTEISYLDGATSNVQTQIDNISGGVVNVKNFGAIGDGIADDRTAIVNAIAALPETGTLFFPTGKYKVSTTITITKSVHFQGVPVLGYVTAAGYEYPAGSMIKSDGNGVAVFEFRSVSLSNTNHANSSISDLSFMDLAGRNDTLVIVRNITRFKVSDCTFSNAAVGLKIDASGDDASWANLSNNHFHYNNIGLFLAKGTTGEGIPSIELYGGDFMILDGQKGIYAENAGQSNMSNFKMDVGGINTIGIDWTGSHSSFSNIAIEMNDVSSTIGIRSNTPRLLMNNISIQGHNSLGTGIKIAKGISRATPNTGNSINNGILSGLGYGIYVADTVTGVKISNIDFAGGMSSANIYLKAGSAYHQISNITSNKFVNTSGGLFDYSTNSTITNYTFIDGGDILQYSGTRIFTNDKTDNYTLALSDIGKLVSMTASTAKTITIPLNATVAFPIGTVIYLSSIGTGDTSIEITSGGTLNSASSMKKIAIQWGQAYIIKTGTDTWTLVGNLKT